MPFIHFLSSTPPLCHNLHVLFRYHRASNLPAVSRFCGFGVAEADEGMSTCLFSLSAPPCPVSGLPVCGGDWDAVDDAAAGSSFALITPREPNHGLIWVFTAGPCFSHQQCERLLKPTPYTFDQICTICLWREMNRLAGVLFFNSPSLCKWFDQAPALMGASSAILRQYYVPKIAWLEIMKAYDFFFFFCVDLFASGRGERDFTEEMLTRPLLLNQQPVAEICKYGHQRIGHIHLITSSLMFEPLQVSISSQCCNQ